MKNFLVTSLIGNNSDVTLVQANDVYDAISIGANQLECAYSDIVSILMVP